MSIIIKDETANAIVLTIDNDGNMAFGDGTPINRLTLNGYGIIDSNGHIVHGIVPGSVSRVEGSAYIPLGDTVSISTLSGRTPSVQVNSSGLAWFANAIDTGTTGPAGQPVATPSFSNIPGLPECEAYPFVGGFIIGSNDDYDKGWYYAPGLPDATCTYRWI